LWFSTFSGVIEIVGGKVKVKVVKTLFGNFVRVQIVARRKERLVALGEKDDLFLAGKVLLPHFIGQGQEECGLGLRNLVVLS
jgi:hypothetical protein